MAATAGVIDALLEVARNVPYGSGDPRDVVADHNAAPPKICHDWRHHVPDEIYEMWETLTLESRLVAYIMASKMADYPDPE